MALIPKIKEQMTKDGEYGEYFPATLSPWAYNETRGFEIVPLTKEQAAQHGFSWREENPREYREATIEVPDHIRDVTDDILKEIIGCAHKAECHEKCSGAFRITPAELAFYREMNLALPRLCPNCRHYTRIKSKSPIKLWSRVCACAGEDSKNYRNVATHFHGAESCPNAFQTSYAPDRKEIIYCESCYQAEVA